MARSVSFWLSLAHSLAQSGSLWLAVRLSLALSDSLWLAVRLSLALSGFLWLTLALPLTHSGSLSSSLRLSMALYCSLNLLTKRLLGSQDPCSARSVGTALQHFNQPWHILMHIYAKQCEIMQKIQ